MVFSSTLFLLLFLPLVLACYFVAPLKLKNTVLLGFSLVFYAWGEGLFVAVMLVSVATNFLCGLGVERYRGHAGARHFLALGIALNLLLLGLFKYTNFLVDNWNALRDMWNLAPVVIDPVHLPIGISFFTFQAMSYLIDVHRQQAQARHNPLNLALYIAMFPQLIAGPIVRYHHVARQIVARRHHWVAFAWGVRRFILGLGKKMLIANPLGAAADQIFALPDTAWTAPLAWLGIGCYTLQIYFDFSGYSDMAIGLGRMFGFRFPENFNFPYISQSIREFWRRWHISLSSWFRDYLYIPLGGSRLGPLRTHINLITVFFLCGLWHGASWNFIIWGLLHGLFLVAERGTLGRILRGLWAPLRHLYVWVVVMVTWVFFRIDTLPEALQYLTAMFGFGQGGEAFRVGLYLNNEVILALAAGVIGATPVVPYIKRMRPRMGGLSRALIDGGGAVAMGLILLVSTLAIAAGTYNPFIYFRF